MSIYVAILHCNQTPTDLRSKFLCGLSPHVAISHCNKASTDLHWHQKSSSTAALRQTIKLLTLHYFSIHVAILHCNLTPTDLQSKFLCGLSKFYRLSFLHITPICKPLVHIVCNIKSIKSINVRTKTRLIISKIHVKFSAPKTTTFKTLR